MEEETEEDSNFATEIKSYYSVNWYKTDAEKNRIILLEMQIKQNEMDCKLDKIPEWIARQ